MVNHWKCLGFSIGKWCQMYAGMVVVLKCSKVVQFVGIRQWMFFWKIKVTASYSCARCDCAHIIVHGSFPPLSRYHCHEGHELVLKSFLCWRETSTGGCPVGVYWKAMIWHSLKSPPAAPTVRVLQGFRTVCFSVHMLAWLGLVWLRNKLSL